MAKDAARRRAPVSPVQGEIKQRRPFTSLQQEALVGLLRTADLVRRRLEHVLEPHAITFQQYNVLRILRGAGDAGLPTLEVAERMIEQAPGITRLLDRLEAKRLVRRERCPGDRRQVLCFITPDGRALLAGLDRPVLEADLECLRGLDPGDLRALSALLDRLRAAHH